MIGVTGLDAQFRSQQIRGILGRVDGDGSIAGRLRFGQSAETSLAAGKVVPEARMPGRHLGGAAVQGIRPLVSTERHRDKCETVICIRNPGWKFRRLGNHLFRIRDSP